MLDSVLQFLGGASGDILFKSPIPLWILATATVVLAGLVLWFYRHTTVQISGRTRAVLTAIKVLPVLFLIFTLLEPVLVTSEVTPQQGFLLVLADDSKSMRLRDMPGSTARIDAVKQTLKEQGVIEALNARFKVRTFRFASDVERIADINELEAEGGATDLARALNQAASEFRDMPLAGIVVVTDGADNANLGSNEIMNATAYLQTQKIPVYAVGVGQKQIDRDIEILKVSTSKTVTTGSVTDLFVTVRAFGYAGKTVDLEIKEGARIIKTERVQFGRDGDTQRINLTLSPDAPGLYEYTARIAPQASEMIPENNQRRFLVDNRFRTARVLYVEGYPRKEFKFIRRALEDDPQIQLASIVRISHDGRLYRQGITSEQELRDGYPKTQKELFGYDAIIFGDIEAAWFTPEQLKFTEEFVSIRGGGFLMLGGEQSFTEGGYGNTPIEDMLPVQLSGGRSPWGTGPVDRVFQMDLTPEGRAHPLMRIAQTPEESRQRWKSLAKLTGYTRVVAAKPGATVLGVDPSADPLEGSNIILAIQRYGKGRSMAFTTASSWRWQMLMPSTDLTHQRFWQQMARWLALSAPNQVVLTLDKDAYAEQEPVPITAHVLDETYEPVNDASVWAQVTGPTGQAEPVELEWDFGADGTYRAQYHPKLSGMHRVEIFVRSPAAITASDQGGFSVAASVAEYTNPTLHENTLKRLADSTGGRYMTLEETRELVDMIPPVKQTSSMVIEHDLRDVPPLFAMIFLLLALEWFLRRRHGLA